MTKSPLPRWSSLRTRLAVVIFIAVAPALGLMFYTGKLWLGLVAGLLAIAAAWVGGGLFILRQAGALLHTTHRFAAGDLTARTGLESEPGEFGELARAFDAMAASLQRQDREREQAEKALLNRAHQQTVVAALGQFALQSSDFAAFLEHAAQFIAQTLEVEYCKVLELLPDGDALLLLAGIGWKDGLVGKATVSSTSDSLAAFTLLAGEPVVVKDLRTETRFQGASLLLEHGVVSGVSVAIFAHDRPFGVLGAHTARRREFTEDEIHFLQAVATVIAVAVERQRVEAELRKLAAFAKLNPNPVLEFRANGEVSYANDAALKLASALGRQSVEPLLPPDVGNIVSHCLATGEARLQLETHPDQRVLWWSFFPIPDSQVVHCFADDMTERTSLEAQLRQSQKMESVGQLAAGVAHDFNNMLTVIQGHAGILLAWPNLAPELSESAQAVHFAAERAASLTRQLLLFSRKSVMQPQPLDLKDVVRNLVKMLKRLLGETITLEFNHPDEVPTIQGDPGMIEQVVMNLSVNARDAMSKGGTLTLSTTPVEISDTYVKRHPDARPGLFVCLRASDTGCGMDAATISRIFEPFFTTKEAGRGTGLGLATVYGIVKQHTGWIEVASESGKGTTFNIFFPATAHPADAATAAGPSPAQVRGGTETILVVEDEPVLLDLAHLILEEMGYHILAAVSGAEALKVWEEKAGRIDLLLTDVVMPGGMTGRELAGKLSSQKPGLKVIYTSGYKVEETTSGVEFLQKPYSRSTLVTAVRKCLDS